MMQVTPRMFERLRHMRRTWIPFALAAAGAAATLVAVGCAGSQTSVAPPPAGHNAAVSAVTVHPLDDVSPTPTPTPIQLQVAGSIGTANWPEGDTATG